MSSSGQVRGARALAGTAPAASHWTANLRLVPDRSGRASSGTFAMFVGGVLAVGLLGLLAVNTALEQGAFAQQRLSTRQTALAQAEQALEQQVLREQSPENLALAAEHLGMVIGGTPTFLQIGTGRVLGVPFVAQEQVSVQPAATSPAHAAPTTAAATKPTAKPTAKAPAKPRTTPTARPTANATPTKPGTP
jgi:cell division septation protein DedD